MVSRDGPWKDDQVMRAKPLEWDWHRYRKKKTLLRAPLPLPPSENIAR